MEVLSEGQELCICELPAGCFLRDGWLARLSKGFRYIEFCELGASRLPDFGTTNCGCLGRSITGD